MLRTAAVAALAAIPFLVGSASAGSYRSDGCASAVDQAVKGSGVDPADVASVSVVPEREGYDRGSVVGLDVWVGLKSCSGNLIIKMDARTCGVRDIYTRGDCSVPGVPNY